MRVLVTWGSKHGGTEGIARVLGDALKEHGFEVTTASADKLTKLDTFDAVIIGGALYANLWPANVRRFVHRHTAQLRKVPVWFFSSGPLDDSAEHQDIPAPTQVAILAERVGAKGHLTFGGRLEPNAKGFPASAMAKTRSGDWRNPERIRAWAARLSEELPRATPGTPVDHRAGSLPRLLAHAVVGWALCVALRAAFLSLVGVTAARVAYVIAAPLIFSALARHYFHPRGARDPLPTAVLWTTSVALLDLVFVAGIARRGLEMFASILGAWLPYALLFLATWSIGWVLSMMPFPKSPAEQGHA